MSFIGLINRILLQEVIRSVQQDLIVARPSGNGFYLF